MGFRKSKKAQEIQRLMQEGLSASQVISQHPELIDGLDDLINVEAPKSSASRGSGAVMSGPDFTGKAEPREQPNF